MTVLPFVADRCVHCEESLADGRTPFAYPASGYVAHLNCISLVNYDDMDDALTRYHAPRKVLRVTPTIESRVENARVRGVAA